MADLNRVLVGGSPSTGSSLLVNILNRHSAICSGPETYLFIHPKLYTEWATYKRYLLRPNPFGGLKSIGWLSINGAILEQDEYDHSITEIRQLIRNSPTLQAFADAFFGHQPKCRTWIEKSPSNVLAFPQFLETIPEAKALLTLRDPYDTIASLVARGMHPLIASSAYLVNNAFALRSFGEPGFFSLNYEEWVQSPKNALQPFLQALKLNWEDQMLQAPDTAPLKMEGWLQDERGTVQTGSIGRFQRLPSAAQAELIQAAAAVRIAPRFAAQHQLDLHSIRDICDQTGYAYHPAPPAPPNWRMVLVRDRLRRLLRLYPTGWIYPVVVS